MKSWIQIVFGSLFFLYFIQSAHAQTVLLQEDFDGSFPPAGWTVVDNVAGGTWQRNVVKGVPNYCAAGSGDCAVAHPGDMNAVFWDTELRSPPIDLTNATWASLTYASMFQDYAGNGEIWVDISTDGGSTWLNLRNQTSDDPPGGTPAVGGTSEIEDLAGYLGHIVTLRWRFQASNTAAWCFHVDSIEVQAALAFYPTITSITPNQGPSEGNKEVTISGQNFATGAVVDFGGFMATNLFLVDSNTITARTPGHPAGPVDVTITNLDLKTGTLINGYTYTDDSTTASIINDRDDDGIEDRFEQGPGQDDPLYDGNGDGVADWQQENVTSFATTASDGDHYVTLAVASGQEISSFQAFASDAAPPMPSWVELPFGYFSFTISGIEENGCTTAIL